MGLRAAWSALWSGETKAASGNRPSFPRFGYGGWWQPRRDRFDYTREVGDPRYNSVVAIVIRWLQEQVPQAELQIGQKNADGEWESDESHPLLEILNRPNPWWSMRSVWNGTIADLKACGNAYWLKARDAGGKGQVREIYWAPAQSIEVEPGVDRPILGYWYTGGGGREWKEPRDVVHFRAGCNPDRPWMGATELQPQLRNLATIANGERYSASAVRKGHAGSMVVPKEAVGQVIAGSPDEAEMIAATGKLERETTGEEAGGITYTTLPIEVIRTGLGPEEMGLDRILDRPESMVVAAMGTNPLVHGLPSSASTRTYANLAEAKRQAWEHGVIPLQDLLADEITSQLLFTIDDDGQRVSEFGDPDAVCCWWDRSGVTALQEDANERATRAAGLFSGGLASRNEAREMVDLPPLVGEEGDQMLGTGPEPGSESDDDEQDRQDDSEDAADV